MADRTVKRGPPGSDAEAERTATGGEWTADRSGAGTVITSAPVTSGLAIVPNDHYQRGEELARGGLGRIVRGRDRRLGRTVAIKELLRETPMTRARFAREAHITARLQHPGVVPIYEAGVWPSGEPFYAMRLVAGRPLSAAITEATTLSERLGLLSRVLVVVETMAYAHSQNVIHRDLKPSNILVGDYGETVVIDWGIAKDLGEPDEAAADVLAPLIPDLTHDGQVMGTPWYMAPEQARGEPTGKPADVYALGAILYHLLAGKPPHGETPGVVQAVASGVAPPPLTSRVDGVPPDLVAIVDKALAAEPEQRYPSAAELADDLRRFLAGQLVSVHRYRPVELVRRWVGRHRAAVAIGAAALVALLVVGAVSIVNVVAARDEARRQEGLATARADELARQRDDLILTQAESALDRDPTQALAWLKKYPASGAGWARVRTIAADAQSRGVARQVLGHGEANYYARLSADGSTLVVASEDSVTIRDAATEAVRARFPLPRARLAAVSADGSRVVAAALDDVDVRLWTGGADPVRLPGHSPRLLELAISADGERVVAAGLDGAVVSWRGAGPARIVRPAGPAPYALFADASRLVTVDTGGVLRVLATDDGAGWTLGAVAGATAVAVSPDGATIAVAARDGLSLWPARGGAPRRLAAGLALTHVGFAGDQAVVATTSEAPLRVWRVADGRETLLAREGPSDVVAMSAQGSIAIGSAAGAIRLLRPDAAGGYHERELRGHRAFITDLQLSDDGRRLVSASYDFDVRVWELADPPATTRRVDEVDLYQLAYVAGGRSVIATARSGAVHAIDLADGAARILGRHGKEAYAVAASRDGALAVTGGWDGGVAVWDVATGAPRWVRTSGAKVWSVTVSPDGRWLAAAADDGVFAGPVTGPLTALPGVAGGASALFAPAGVVLAGGGDDNAIHLWDVPAPAARLVLRGHDNKPSRLAFSTDGRTLVSGGFDGTVRRWDTVSGAGALLGRHRGSARAVAVSPDGRYAASGGRDGVVHVYDLTGGTDRVLGRHGAEARDVAFSPDGTTLASAGSDYTVRLWDLASGSSLPLRGALKFHRVVFRGDGAELSACNEDGSIMTVALPVPGAVPIEPAAVRAWLASVTTARAE